MKKYYYIGKTNADTVGNKGKPKYILSSLSKTKKECEGMTSFLAGFGGYEVVKVEIREVENVPACLRGKTKAISATKINHSTSQTEILKRWERFLLNKKMEKIANSESKNIILLDRPRIYGRSTVENPELIALQKDCNRKDSERIDKANKKVKGKK